MAALVMALGYLLGSVPFGLLAGWLAGKDIRREGSGNIGATNVLRVCGWKLGLPVFVLDAGKGVAAVLIAKALVPQTAPDEILPVILHVLSGLAAILGHNFPIWLGFKGGKGVASSAGVVGALMPLELAVAVVFFAVIVLATRYVSLGSILASVALVLARLMLVRSVSPETLPLTVLALVLCLLVILRHRANIRRLLAGTENRIGQTRGGAAAPAVEDGPATGTDEETSA